MRYEVTGIVVDETDPQRRIKATGNMGRSLKGEALAKIRQGSRIWIRMNGQRTNVYASGNFMTGEYLTTGEGGRLFERVRHLPQCQYSSRLP